jgi:acid phosphatase
VLGAFLKAAVATTLIATAGLAQTPPLPQHREVKWVRDSEEYATLVRMVYRSASRAVESLARQVPRGRAWAVVLDVDETALDNTVYEMDRRTYNQPHTEPAFAAYIARRQAAAVPGVQDFIAAVRRLGGRVVYNTNRLEPTREGTRANLAAHGLWTDQDRLCLMVPGDTAYTKAARRAEVASGTGRCGFGEPAQILVFVGDAMGDFPGTGEADPDSGNDAAFGSRYFVLPNPMYGSWERTVTRRP